MTLVETETDGGTVTMTFESTNGYGAHNEKVAVTFEISVLSTYSYYTVLCYNLDILPI